MHYLSDEELISETSGLSSIGQVDSSTANEVFSFNDGMLAGEVALLYFNKLPKKYIESLKEKYLREFRSIIKVKVKNTINLKEIYDEQLEEKYINVF